MVYDFDKIIDRKNTNSLKYDFSKERNKPNDVLPLWVADMDFQAPQEVIDALIAASKHGIFGYSEVKADYFNAVQNWYNKYFKWNIEEDWLVKTPGIVYALTIAIKAFTNENDSVLIQQPVYYPFSEAIINNKRNLINNSLHYEDNTYTIDFEDFEKKIIDKNVKLFLLCNPHNPVGRVWSKQELTKLGDICLKHNVVIISDEIHADFVYSGNNHTVLANIKPEFSNIAITCTAPSKTFNIAGLQVSNIFIKNKDLRTKFIDEFVKSGYSQLNTLGLVACQAAYEHGRQWFDALIIYLESNLNFAIEFINKRIPQVKLIKPEGTYLIWIDFNSLNLSDEELDDLIINKAKLWLDSGTMFGKDGKGFERINIACPRAILEKALLQLESAIANFTVNA